MAETQSIQSIQSRSFQDAMTELYMQWENSQTDMLQLREAFQATEQSLLEQRNINHELSNENKDLGMKLASSQKEVEKFKRKVQEAEDDQKQFTKVSHIINMERETTHLKQQIAILERRVAFYQNQCNELKDQKNTLCLFEEQSTQTETQDVTTVDIDTKNEVYNDQEQETNACNTQEDEEDGLNVVEKKIKGIVYYVSDDGDIYDKNEDESIGQLKGKMEVLSSGKTKVKWFK